MGDNKMKSWWTDQFRSRTHDFPINRGAWCISALNTLSQPRTEWDSRREIQRKRKEGGTRPKNDFFQVSARGISNKSSRGDLGARPSTTHGDNERGTAGSTRQHLISRRSLHSSTKPQF